MSFQSSYSTSAAADIPFPPESDHDPGSLRAGNAATGSRFLRAAWRVASHGGSPWEHVENPYSILHQRLSSAVSAGHSSLGKVAAFWAKICRQTAAHRLVFRVIFMSSGNDFRGYVYGIPQPTSCMLKKETWMTRITGFPTLFCLCSVAALSACTMNTPPSSQAYAPPSVQTQYGTYAPAEAAAAPYALAPQAAASAGEASASESSPLVVRDLTTQKVTIGGQDRLLIEGNIVNVSPVSQTAAALYGKVLNSQDAVLRNLPIPGWSPVVVLPGASLHFRIDTSVPPPPAARVRVTVTT